MPDPIWLDTNVVARAANGDAGIESLLKLYRADGHELLLAPKANDELLYGNPLTITGKNAARPVTEMQPSPATRANIELTKARLGIKVDLRAGELSPSKRVGYALQDHVPRPKNKAVPASLDNISESDSLVLSQIMGSAEVRGIKRPVMLTAETGKKGMISQAQLYRVNVVKVPSPAQSSSGPVKPPPAGPSSPPAKTGSTPPTSAPTGSFWLGLGRMVLAVGVQLVIAYVAQKWRDKVDKSIIENDMKSFEPEIQNFITAYRRWIINNVTSGEPAYVNSRIRIEYMMTGVQNGQQPDFIRSDPLVHLDSLWISEKSHDGEVKHWTDTPFGVPGFTDVYDYTFSVSVGDRVSEEQRQLYLEANAQIKLYKTMLDSGVTLTNATRDEIKREIDEMYDALNYAFGRMSDFKPNRNLWTEEGYKSMMGLNGGVVY